MKNKIYISLIILFMVTSLSYWNAKRVAANIMGPIENKIIFEDLDFQFIIPIGYLEDHKYHFGLWRASFCPKDDFCCFPMEIYMSLDGRVLLTNPRDLNELIDYKSNLRKLPNPRVNTD